MSKETNVAIIGCGYVGLEVAKMLSQKKAHVTATTRKPERLSELSKVAQKSIIVKGNDEDEFVPIIANNETIIITIASDSTEHYESAYLRTSSLFRHLALEMDLPRTLIYVSSASVYGDHHGRWVDEASELLAKGEQAKILIESEKNYRSLEEIGWDVCVLRFAEVYGPGREISKKVRSFMDHPLPGTGDQYTNMVHREDCVSAINYALIHHLTGVYNLADDDHSTKKELYDEISKKTGLNSVKWDPNLSSLPLQSKRVSNHKIHGAGFHFIHSGRILD